MKATLSVLRESAEYRHRYWSGMLMARNRELSRADEQRVRMMASSPLLIMFGRFHGKQVLKNK